MWWVIFKYASLTVVSILFGLVFATNANAWSPNVSPDSKYSDVKAYHSSPCPGNFGTIAVSGEGSIQACIMGQTTKVASYYPTQGGVGYAISFPFESTFYRLDVCQGIWGCVYADENDTLAGVTGVYKQFVANLSKSVQAGVIHYSPTEASPIFSVGQFAGRSFSPETVATSQNGKWVLAELKSYGFLRINVQTSEVRRIIAPGNDYGYGRDPRVEMAITNDGSTVAIVGLRMGLQLISVDDTCGDRLSEFMQKYYAGAVTACASLQTPTEKFIPNFLYALRPIFSNDGKIFSFDAYSSSVAARHITMFSDNSDAQKQPLYLALGDSFVSGEGEVDDSYYLGGATNKCHLSSRSYPFLLANPWNITARSTACSGATMQTARGISAKTHQPLQLSELELHPPQVATIGIGGNDIGLIGKLKDCLGTDTCRWAGTATSRHQTAMEIKSLYPHLKQFYADVKVRTLGPVIVVGYPRIITSQQPCMSPLGALLNQTERIFMNEAIHYLNQVIQAAASDVGVGYADIENALNGGELCSSIDAPLVNSVRAGSEYSVIAAVPSIKIFGSESFHPKPEAHVKVATTILQKFSNLNTAATYMNNGNPTVVPTPSSYWDVNGGVSKPQRAVPFLGKITIKKKDLFEVSFPAFTFKPSTEIVLELHSDIKNLGTVKSAKDGSLDTTISSTDFETGFHSVHAIGKNFVGNEFAAYDFLLVEDENEATVTTPPGDAPGNLPTLSTVGSSYAVAGILGGMAVNTPSLGTVTRSSETVKPVSKDSGQNEKQRYNWAIVSGLVVVLVVSATRVYFYNRQK